MGILIYTLRLDDDPPPSAPLMALTCPDCLGDGWVETPETGYRCAACDGSGNGPEVCSGCLQAPEVVHGLERCGCNSLKAAA